jgi:hypothetical protein
MKRFFPFSAILDNCFKGFEAIVANVDAYELGLGHY